MHHILVVDDETDICDVIKSGFEARGKYRVRCATNKPEAFAALRLERPDMALLDILMRENAGLEIGALAAELHVPVLRMSGHPMIVHDRRLEGLPVLAKPFRVGDLVETVDRLIIEAHRLQNAMEENIRAGRQLVSESQANIAATARAWEQITERWNSICQELLKDGGIGR